MPSLSGLFSAGLPVVVGFLLQVHTRTHKLRDKYSGVLLVWWMLVDVAVSGAATSLHLDLSPCSKHCSTVRWLASSILQKRHFCFPPWACKCYVRYDYIQWLDCTIAAVTLLQVRSWLLQMHRPQPSTAATAGYTARVLTWG